MQKLLRLIYVVRLKICRLEIYIGFLQLLFFKQEMRMQDLILLHCSLKI